MRETTKIILCSSQPTPRELLLKDWSVVDDGKIKYLTGKVYGHPDYADGDIIGTSELVRMENGYAEVSSGKRYKLEIKVAVITTSSPIIRA